MRAMRGELRLHCCWRISITYSSTDCSTHARTICIAYSITHCSADRISYQSCRCLVVRCRILYGVPCCTERVLL